MNNKLTTILVVALVILVLVFLFGFSTFFRSSKPDPTIDAFAQCLAAKDATMYGAYWCAHCKNQKQLFGDSFKYVNYVECTEETGKCLAVGVNAYPTWIFSDGQKHEGEMSFEELSAASGCPLGQETK
jgi:hypothetical protein